MLWKWILGFLSLKIVSYSVRSIFKLSVFWVCGYFMSDECFAGTTMFSKLNVSEMSKIYWKFVFLFFSFSMYDKLPDPHCDCRTSSPREDLHFKEAHSLLKLDRCANQRYELRSPTRTQTHAHTRAFAFFQKSSSSEFGTTRNWFRWIWATSWKMSNESSLCFLQYGHFCGFLSAPTLGCAKLAGETADLL